MRNTVTLDFTDEVFASLQSLADEAGESVKDYAAAFVSRGVEARRRKQQKQQRGIELMREALTELKLIKEGKLDEIPIEDLLKELDEDTGNRYTKISQGSKIAC